MRVDLDIYLSLRVATQRKRTDLQALCRKSERHTVHFRSRFEPPRTLLLSSAPSLGFVPFLRRFLKAQDPTERILFDLGEAAGIVSAFEAFRAVPGRGGQRHLVFGFATPLFIYLFFCKAARRCFLGDLGRGDYFLRVFGVLRTLVLSWLYGGDGRKREEGVSGLE